MEKSILEELRKQSEDSDRDYAELFGQPNLEVTRSPKYQQILAILRETPLLVQPCLNWLQVTQARIAQATLNVLYTPEQLEELKTKVEGESSQ